jgi:hypothetical protein
MSGRNPDTKMSTSLHCGGAASTQNKPRWGISPQIVQKWLNKQHDIRKIDFIRTSAIGQGGNRRAEPKTSTKDAQRASRALTEMAMRIA